MAPDTVASASPHAIHSRAEGASVIQVESSRLLPWLMLCCIFSAIATVGFVMTFYQLTKVEREVRIEQLIQEDQNAIMIREGLKQPTDNAHGPGNYQYDPNYRKEKAH